MINFYNYLTDKKVSQSIYEMLFDKFMQSDEPTYREYTGTLPVTITANGSDLTDWIIYGNTGGVGDETANLLNVSMQNVIFYNDYPKSVYDNFTINDNVVILEANKAAFFAIPAKVEENTLYYVQAKSLIGGGFTFRIRYYTDLPNNRSDNFISTAVNTSVTGTYTNSFTTPENCNYMLFEIYHDNTVGEQQVGQLMINAISNSYEPYGYKISILSNSEPVNIYIDSPLGLNETVSKSDTNINIPTDNGTTVISCDNTVQPEKIYIKYIGG